MKNLRFALLIIVACSLVISVTLTFGQGSLTPPGAPAPTMKTLQEIEPRTPITNLPYTISTAGSYYLVTNLVGTTGTNGITIASDDVTLDLNGFALIGVPGSVNGVYVSGARDGISIRNGTVRNWGDDGVDASYADSSQFTDLKTWTNGYGGLRTGRGSVISRCVARGNSDVGIYASNGSTVRDCTAQYNNTGIYVSEDSAISGCTAKNNSSDGITGWSSCTVSGCTGDENGDDGILIGWNSIVRDSSAKGNTGDGIEAYYSCMVIDCSASFNSGRGIYSWSWGGAIKGCTVNHNTGNGIQVDSDSRVSENICDENGYSGDGAGIYVTGGESRIDGNSATDNDRGIQVGSAGNLIIRNSASGNGTNYVILAGNSIGGIVDVSGSGFTNTNPWVNFEF